MSSNEETDNAVKLLEHFQYKWWIMQLLQNSFERSKDEYKAIQDLSIKLITESAIMCMNKNAKEASKFIQYLHIWPYLQMMNENQTPSDDR